MEENEPRPNNVSSFAEARQAFRIEQADKEEGRQGMIVCSPRLYQYRGIIIECSGIGGPWACNKKGEPYVRYPRHVSAAINDFCELSDEEKQKLRIGGGCTFVGEGHHEKA